MLVASKSDPFLQEVVAEVLARYDRRAGFDVAGRNATTIPERNSEGSHLNGAIENKHAAPSACGCVQIAAADARIGRGECRKGPGRLSSRFEVACDEVVGRGEFGAQLREHRAQVQRVVDAVEPRCRLRNRTVALVRHVPAVSDETLAEVRADAGPFLQEVVDLVWDRYDRLCGLSARPSEERYDDDDRRRQSEEDLSDRTPSRRAGRPARFVALVDKGGRCALARRQGPSVADPRHLHVRARRRSPVDELRDRQQEQSVRPPGVAAHGRRLVRSLRLRLRLRLRAMIEHHTGQSSREQRRRVWRDRIQRSGAAAGVTRA